MGGGARDANSVTEHPASPSPHDPTVRRYAGMNTLEMFPLEKFEQLAPQNDGDGIDEDAGPVPEPNNIDAISKSS